MICRGRPRDISRIAIATLAAFVILFGCPTSALPEENQKNNKGTVLCVSTNLSQK